MTAGGKNGDDAFETLVAAFLNRTAADERLSDVLSEVLAAEEATSSAPPDTVEKAVKAARAGMFDGATQRARAQMKGALTTFPSALRRIREAARRSPQQMAERAEISPEDWVALEAQSLRYDQLTVAHLASVVEAAQLRLGEFEALLRRTESVRLVSPAQASFRADLTAEADQAAAYEHLLLTLAEEEQASTGVDTVGNDDIANVVAAVGTELARRGRRELLKLSE